jgi:hypothetical protein
MYLTREDVKLIGEIMAEMPNAESFRLESDGSSGIGQILTLIVRDKVMGRMCDIRIEIGGVERW